MSPPVTVRPARPADVGQIHAYIVELAEFERAREQVVGTPAMLATALFGDTAAVEALIAEVNAAPAGFALFFASFSTWECRAGIWLEDLYVSPAQRGAGVGAALLSAIARIAVLRECARVEWEALDWNESALAFYARLGAQRLPEWERHRLSGTNLRRVAGVSGS